MSGLWSPKRLTPSDMFLLIISSLLNVFSYKTINKDILTLTVTNLVAESLTRMYWFLILSLSAFSWTKKCHAFSLSKQIAPHDLKNIMRIANNLLHLNRNNSNVSINTLLRQKFLHLCLPELMWKYSIKTNLPHFGFDAEFKYLASFLWEFGSKFSMCKRIRLVLGTKIIFIQILRPPLSIRNYLELLSASRIFHFLRFPIIYHRGAA